MGYEHSLRRAGSRTGVAAGMSKVKNKAHCTPRGAYAMAWQRGAAAIEFMMIMMIMLPAFYVAVALAVTLLAQQVLTQAAAEGARAALRSGSLNQRQAYAMQAAKNSVKWPSLSSNAVLFAADPTYPCPATSTTTPSQCILHVEVTLSQPLVANWPGLGNLIPQQLIGEAAVTLDTSTLGSS